MRSLLIAPADEKRLAEALASGADAVIVDLAQAAPAKGLRRGPRRRGFSSMARARDGAPALVIASTRSIRAKPTLTSMRSWPTRLTPLCCRAASGRRASSSFRPSLRCGRRISTSRTAQRKSSPSPTRRGRFWGWPAIAARAGGSRASPGAPRRLRVDIGAESDRDQYGAYAGAFRLARDLTLLAAAAAGVAAIDAAFADVANTAGLRAEAIAARRDGFSAKLAISPEQARVIGDVFGSRPIPLEELDFPSTDRWSSE